MLILYLLKKGSKGVDLIRVKVYNKVSRKVIKKKVEVPNKNFYLFLFYNINTNYTSYKLSINLMQSYPFSIS